MAAAAAGGVAVAALKKFIDDSEIKIRAKVDLNALWKSIVDGEDSALKTNGWVVNCTKETVRFYVYNSNDWIDNSPLSFLRVPAHKVDAQPGETVHVHGGATIRPDEHMKVYKDDKGIGYNVLKNHLHFWTGSRMFRKGDSTLERFKNEHYDPTKQLKDY